MPYFHAFQHRMRRVQSTSSCVGSGRSQNPHRLFGNKVHRNPGGYAARAAASKLSSFAVTFFASSAGEPPTLTVFRIHRFSALPASPVETCHPHWRNTLISGKRSVVEMAGIEPASRTHSHRINEFFVSTSKVFYAGCGESNPNLSAAFPTSPPEPHHLNTAPS